MAALRAKAQLFSRGTCFPRLKPGAIQMTEFVPGSKVKLWNQGKTHPPIPFPKLLGKGELNFI